MDGAGVADVAVAVSVAVVSGVAVDVDVDVAAAVLLNRCTSSSPTRPCVSRCASLMALTHVLTCTC